MLWFFRETMAALRQGARSRDDRHTEGRPCGRGWVLTVGRPTKCTPERIAEIADMVRHGVPIRHAAIAVGVAESTVHSWLQRGARAKSGVYLEFLEAVTRAQAASVAGLVARVSKAAETDWRAAAWLLTRSAPAEFIDPAKRGDLLGAEARSRVIVQEAEDRLRHLERRQQIMQELDDDGRET